MSQKFIVGSIPTPSHIADEMKNRGFMLIPGFSIGSEPDSSFYCHSRDIAIFDAVPDNFIESQGIPIPIDVIPISVGAKLRRQLLELMS